MCLDRLYICLERVEMCLERLFMCHDIPNTVLNWCLEVYLDRFKVS